MKPFKIVHILPLIIITTILTSCNSHEIDGDKVYFVITNEAVGKNKILIRGADAETFKELEHSKYGIDKQNVYYEALKLVDADPKTFVALLDNYGKDEKFAYRDAKKINGADSKTFEVIEGGPYSKDNKDYYFDTIGLNVTDYNSFKIIRKDFDLGFFAKDMTHYYLAEKKYPLADYESFINLGNGYFKDKLNVYHLDSIVEQVDPATFMIIDWKWQKDKSTYFYKGKPMTIVDYNTFAALQIDYAKDKNNVYYFDKIVEGADPVTFKVDNINFIGKDKYGTYKNGKNLKQ